MPFDSLLNKCVDNPDNFVFIIRHMNFLYQFSAPGKSLNIRVEIYQNPEGPALWDRTIFSS